MNNFVPFKQASRKTLDIIFSSINEFISQKICSTFDQEQIIPVEINTTPNSDELLKIASNLQKIIVSDDRNRTFIFSGINPYNLNLWNEILLPERKLIESYAISDGVIIPSEYFTAKSVITPKTMQFDKLISFLDDNFGKNLFPSFSYEDAAALIFIKPIFPFWFQKQLSNYQNDITHYINYLAFALKLIIEEIKEIEIKPFCYKSCIKTYSAAQNILIYLNSIDLMKINEKKDYLELAAKKRQEEKKSFLLIIKKKIRMSKKKLIL